MTPRVQEALDFAREAHKGQKRKYSGEDYIVHPIEVAEIVASVGGTEEQIMAGLLHDVAEDTKKTLADITARFGPIVGGYVEGLTDVSKLTDGNRRVRKEIDRRHTKATSPAVKTIKLADLISNAPSIITQDPGFARVWMVEKMQLLEVLKEGDPVLLKHAVEIVSSYLGTNAGVFKIPADEP